MPGLSKDMWPVNQSMLVGFDLHRVRASHDPSVILQVGNANAWLPITLEIMRNQEQPAQPTSAEMDATSIRRRQQLTLPINFLIFLDHSIHLFNGSLCFLHGYVRLQFVKSSSAELDAFLRIRLSDVKRCGKSFEAQQPPDRRYVPQRK